mgnify:CR=1 FL=1
MAVKKIVKSNYIQEFVIGFIAEVSILRFVFLNFIFYFYISKNQITRRVQHENIVQFIGACADIPNVVILTELVEPGSLRDVLRNKRIKLDRPEKYDFVSNLADLFSIY